MVEIFYWRITKYDPKNRDENGFYINDEWTSVSDIGKKYDDVEFTFDSYLFYENAYVDAVLKIMQGNNLQALKIKSLQKKLYNNYSNFIEPDSKRFYKSLKTNTMISIQDISQIVRFALREIIWCKLVSDRMLVHFGYDYYMYVGSEYKSQEMLDVIKSNGLFVDEMKSPYL